MSQRFVLIGHPVGHSISPAIHHEAYRRLRVDASYGLADCPEEGAVRAVVQRIRDGELLGANVTVPWKQVAFDLADEHHRTALDVGVANVLARTSDGRIIAYNTDASALGTELKRAVEQSGVSVQERSTAVVIGSGGAALAAVVACRLAGAEDIVVSARRYDPTRLVEEWPRAEAFKKLGARVCPWPSCDPEPFAENVKQAHLLVQATSAGMKGTSGGDELAALIPWDLASGAAAYDLVYTPPVTPFLAQAQAAGLSAVGGLGMLVGQARDAIEIWLGKAPTTQELTGVAQEALGL